MQIIDSCRVLAPLQWKSGVSHKTISKQFDVAFGVGEKTILANTAQSDVLRHSGPQTSASTIRNEGRKRDRRKARAERGFDEWKPGLRVQSDTKRP